MASNQLEISARTRKRVLQGQTNSVDDKLILKDLGYTLLKKIGHGSFAKVWRAKAVQFKREVAVKIIAKHKASKEYVEKFLPRELDIIQKLKHPNIIRFYEITEARHSVYIIMQLAEKGTIAELIDSKKNLPEDTARILFRQLMDVIDFCHRNGVVHRDIKCENLLLDRNYKLLVTDFGFAKQDVFPLTEGRVRRSRTYCGSYAYASPEVLSNIPYDPLLSDVWCMGMVLYTMLVGYLPYKQTDVKMLIAAKKKPPKFPETPEISGRGKHFVKRMLTTESERSGIRELKKDPWMLTNMEEEDNTEEDQPIAATSTSGSYRKKTKKESSKLSIAFSFSSDEKQDKAVLVSVKKKMKTSTSSLSDLSIWAGTMLRSKLE